MANYFPDDLIQEIIAANDIVDVVSSYVQLKQAGNGLIGLCPFHKEKTPSFHISPDKQLYHCFGCGVGGTVIHFIMAAENLDFVESVKFLADRAHIIIPEDHSSGQNEVYEKKQKIYQMNKIAARFFYQQLFTPEGAGAREYVKTRHLTKETVTAYGIGYAPNSWNALLNHLESQGFHRDLIVEAGLAKRNEKGNVYDLFRDRLMFPVIDVRGNVIAFSGRVLDPEAKGYKYVNSPETLVFHKSNSVFSLNVAKKSGKDNIILVEGQMDVISLYQHGIPNAIATLGTAITDEQARLISRFTKNVTICYDADTAGQKAATRAIQKFDGLDVNVSVMEIPEGKDPDEYLKKHSAESFENLAENAKNTTAYQISKLKNQYNLDDIQQKIEFVNEAAAFLATVPNEIERDAFIRRLSQETDIAVNAIMTEIRKNARRTVRKKERDELKEIVRTTRKEERAQERQGIDFKLSELEKSLLSYLFSDLSVYRKFGKEFPPERFTVPLHKKVAEAIYRAWETGVAPNGAELLLLFPSTDSGAVSEIINRTIETEENLKAAEDICSKIKETEWNSEMERIANSGDVEALNRLLMKKKEQRREGQANE